MKDNLPVKPFVIGYAGLVVTFLGSISRFFGDNIIISTVSNVVFIVGVVLFFIGVFKVLDIYKKN